MDTTRTPSPTDAATAVARPTPAELAYRLDCLTEHELCTLTRTAPDTPSQWRKRGIGPAYVRFGNAFLYPREALTEYLRQQLRKPAGRIHPREVL